MVFSENRRNIFFMCENKKKSLGAKSGLCGGSAINWTFWPLKKALIWADVQELALPLWTTIRLFLFVFRISAKKLWWNCGSELIVQRCSREQSLHDQFCRPSASKCFFHKHLSLDLAWFQRPTRWTVVLFRAHTHSCMIFHLWQSYKRHLKNRHRIFSNLSMQQSKRAFLSDCGIQRGHKFFTAWCSCNIEFMLLEEMSKYSSI